MRVWALSQANLAARVLATVPEWIDVGIEIHGSSLRSSGSDAVLKTIASVLSHSHDAIVVRP